MKKKLIALTVILIASGFGLAFANETGNQEVITIEIPANQIETIDVKYKNQTPSATSKFKDSTNKTVSKTKEVTEKTVTATKKATKKTIQSTKDFTNKTVDNTKEIIDNLNPNKPVTLESLEASASVKKLKIERDTKKAAYNSKIKDIKAQIKAAEYSTTLTEAERQNKVYTLNKEKTSLIEQRDDIVKEYNDKISEIKNNK